MNCANHPDNLAVAFCRECGKPMCAACQRPALGSVYCAEHAPAPAPPPPSAPPPPPYAESPYASRPGAGSSYTPPDASPYASAPPPPYTVPPPPYMAPPPVDGAVHPMLALILGFLPGVGAIYNGQYAKGLIHAVIFGLLVSIVSNTHSGTVGAFVGIMIGAWVIYQAFEAYHTARKRRYGMHVEEFSSLLDVQGSNHRYPVGAILLIGIGFILLLDTTDIIRMEQFEHYWPVLLIVVGIYLLYNRLHPASQNSAGEVRR